MRQSDKVADDIALANSSGINNYGTEGDSVSLFVHNTHDSVEEHSSDTNSDDMVTAHDGTHSDLF
jgi:hypothetical protein